MNAKEIADIIRPKLNVHEASQIPPDEQLLLKLSVEVCEELDMEPTPINISHVAQLIREEGIVVKEEFPKTLYHPEYDPSAPEPYHVIIIHNPDDMEDYSDWRETPYPEGEEPGIKAKEKKHKEPVDEGDEGEVLSDEEVAKPKKGKK